MSNLEFLIVLSCTFVLASNYTSNVLKIYTRTNGAVTGSISECSAEDDSCEAIQNSDT